MAKKKERKQESQPLDMAINAIEKEYGKGSIMRLGDGKLFEVEAIPTGALELDLALGVGGLPRGRVVEIYGPEASGKTTLALHCVANAQRAGGTAAFIDAEHALDPAYARKLGVNVNDLLLSQPDFGEQALDIAEILVRSNAVDIVVVDSVAALVPKAELEGEMGDAHVGLQARLMSQALRKLTAAISRSKCVMVFINQVRQKIAMGYGATGETTPGGRALKFYASVRIDVRRISAIKSGDTTIGSRVRAIVSKNKVAPPFRRAEFEILFDRGITHEGALLSLGVKHGVITKSGSWYSFGETRLGQGFEKVVDFLLNNKDIADAIEREIRLQAGALTPPPAVEPPEMVVDPAPAKEEEKSGGE